MEKFTAKEIAEKFNVKKIVAQNWIQKNLFPNAYKENIAPFGEIWYVPASDVENFQRPERGRPRSDRPSPEAVLKRQLREQGRKAA